MAKNKRIAKRFGFKNPRFKNDEHEFPRGEKGLVMCGDCRAVNYQKRWRHSLLQLKPVKETTPIKFAVCPACRMIKNHQFEGEVTIINVPPKLKTEMVNFIKAFCRRAYDRDPLDRLIEIKNEKNNLIVHTTENQLANKLGRKIENLFNRNKLKAKTSYVKAPSDVGRVRIEFLS